MLNDDVNFDIYLAEDDVRASVEFPPHRFDARDQRFAALKRLRRGDLTGHLNALPKDPVSLNWFGTYSSQIANMLLMSRPEGEVSVAEMFSALVDQTSLGGCVWYTLEGAAGVIDPSTWYPLRDGGFYSVAPYVSEEAESPKPDRAEAWYFDGSLAERAVFAWFDSGAGRGRFGSLIEPWTGMGESRYAVVPRMPQVGMWGTSKYLQFASPVVEIANRLTRNSRVLDLNGRPIPVVSSSQADLDQLYALDTDSDAEKERKIDEALADELGKEVVHLPDKQQSIDFAQPNVDGVRVALEQVDSLKEAIKFSTGLPDLTGDYQPPSGEALKRELLPLYSETSAMQNAQIEALRDELGIEVDWPHIFDVLEGDTDADSI